MRHPALQAGGTMARTGWCRGLFGLLTSALGDAFDACTARVAAKRCARTWRGITRRHTPSGAHNTHHGTHSRHCWCIAHTCLLTAAGTHHLRRHIMVVGFRMAKSGCAPQCGEQCRRGSVPRTEALPQTRALLYGRHTGRMPGVNSHVLLSGGSTRLYRRFSHMRCAHGSL